jgi:hypothetical protein
MDRQPWFSCERMKQGRDARPEEQRKRTDASGSISRTCTTTAPIRLRRRSLLRAMLRRATMEEAPLVNMTVTVRQSLSIPHIAFGK